MNLLEYCNSKMDDKTEKENIVDRLNDINNKIVGRACWERSMVPGKATGFVIWNLKTYHEEILNKKLENYLEIGVLWGGSLCSLYASGFSGTAYGLDIYKGYYGNSLDPVSRKRFPGDTSNEHKKIVQENCSIYGGSPKLVIANSQNEDFEDILEKNVQGKMNVILIDGDHSYKGAINDYRKTIQILETDGILLLDNFEMNGVAQAAKEIVNEGLVKEIGVWNKTTWIGIKK